VILKKLLDIVSSNIAGLGIISILDISKGIKGIGSYLSTISHKLIGVYLDNAEFSL